MYDIAYNLTIFSAGLVVGTVVVMALRRITRDLGR